MSKTSQGAAFERRVAEMFKARGNFKNVDVTSRSNDGGIDIYMDEITPSGTIIRCGVECKDHAAPIGRPVIQKFHSALGMYISGPKHGYVVTSGRFSQKAIDYTYRINNEDKDTHIELIDGKKLELYEHEIIETKRIEEERRINEPKRIEEERKINEIRKINEAIRIKEECRINEINRIKEAQKANETIKINETIRIKEAKRIVEEPRIKGVIRNKEKEESKIKEAKRIEEECKIKEIRKINEAIRIKEECRINKIRRKNKAHATTDASSKDLTHSELTRRAVIMLMCCFVFVVYILVSGS